MTARDLQSSDLNEKLRIYLAAIRDRNPQLSLRNLARRLMINSTSLSLFLSGKRELSKKLFREVLAQLGNDPEFKTDAFLAELARSQQEDGSNEDDRLQLTSNWLHLAVLALLETKNATSDPQWLANRLHAPLDEVTDALNVLERLALVKRSSEGGSLRPTGRPLSAGALADPASTSRAHGSVLDRSAWHFSQLQEGQGSSLPSSFTVAIAATNLTAIELVKKEIARFRRRVEMICDGGSKRDVFLLAIELLPLTAAFKKLDQP